MPVIGGHPEPVAFYKDKEGVVHLRGEVSEGTPNTVIFRLPPGYRPASGRFIEEPVACFRRVLLPLRNEQRSYHRPELPEPSG